MKTLHILLFSLLTLSCSVGFNIDKPQKFSCESDDDCESGYECKANICEVIKIETGGCDDADKDGFGVGLDRGECRECRKTDSNGSGCIEDPNDNDADIYPGAHEICDGKDNDSDGTIDNTETPVGFESTVPAEGENAIPKTECVSANDCPQATQEGVSTFCDTNTKKCVARMTISLGSPECNANNLICTDGAFPAVPENCGGPAQ